MAALYAFVVLVSVQTHQHSHLGEGALGFGKVGDNPVVFLKGGEAKDCIACHFMTKTKWMQPLVFEFDFAETKWLGSEFSEDVCRWETSDFYTQPLRGPPVDLI